MNGLWRTAEPGSVPSRQLRYLATLRANDCFGHLADFGMVGMGDS